MPRYGYTTCSWCGNEYPCSGGHNGFCSQGCYQQKKEMDRKEYESRNAKECDWCKRKFDGWTAVSGSGWSSRIYCSKRCKNEAEGSNRQPPVAQKNSSGGSGGGCMAKIKKFFKWIIIIIVIIFILYLIAS